MTPEQLLSAVTPGSRWYYDSPETGPYRIVVLERLNEPLLDDRLLVRFVMDCDGWEFGVMSAEAFAEHYTPFDSSDLWDAADLLRAAGTADGATTP